MKADESLASLLRHSRAALRAERVLLEAGLARAVRRGVLTAFAGIIAIFGLAAFDAAAFFALAPLWGRAYAMVVVGLGDFAVAALLLGLARIDARNPNLAFAEEMRDSALQAIELDVKLAGNSLGRLVRNPLELLWGPIVSVALTALAGIFKPRRGQDKR